MAAKMNYINGEWVPAKSGKTRKIINPATSEVIAEVADSAVEDVRDAIAAAKESFYGPGEWRRMAASARSKKLLEVADEIEKITDELCKLESMNTGMTYNNGPDQQVRGPHQSPRCPSRHPVRHRQGAHRRRRHDRSLERALPDVLLEGGSCPGSRQQHCL